MNGARGRRAAAWAVVAAALALTCACGADSSESVTLTGNAASGEDEGGAKFNRAYVDAVYADRSGLQLPLPVQIPAGYQFLGFHGSTAQNTQRADDEVIARDASFAGPTDIVEICAEVLGTGSNSCPESNVGIEHDESNIRRTVFVEIVDGSAGAVDSSSTDAFQDAWGEVAYSDDPDDWTWLR